MIFFALSVFTLGLVTAEPNGSMTTTWATTNTSDVTQGTQATADSTTNDTTADSTTNDTTFLTPQREQTTGGGAINAPSAQSANPNPNETPKPITTPNPETTSSTTSAPIHLCSHPATTTRAKPTKDVVKKTTAAGSHESGPDAIGITIICVVVLICLLIVVGCFVKRNCQSRYSVDLRTEAASVPLSVVVDHTEPGDSTVYTGMQTSDNGQVDSKKSQDSQNNEVPKPKDSGPAEDPKPKESGVAEDPQPKDSGVAEVPQPMTEQKD
ncbi:mucin-2-like isoform X2 [Gadus chalcogrammus]|nr:mucin-2-like isoform X2 [Gadus chalcogrammus]